MYYNIILLGGLAKFSSSFSDCRALFYAFKSLRSKNDECFKKVFFVFVSLSVAGFCPCLPFFPFLLNVSLSFLFYFHHYCYCYFYYYYCIYIFVILFFCVFVAVISVL